MKNNLALTATLALIAVFLGLIALRPPWQARAAVDPQDLYIEPGTHTIRAPDSSAQLVGKIVIDLRNGNVWGFPTNSKAPYPVAELQNQPPTSRPILLGRFDLSAMTR